MRKKKGRKETNERKKREEIIKRKPKTEKDGKEIGRKKIRENGR